ncbi:MAG: hypothetical protein DMF60_04055 [Acidobacteria bacterium]|nr:MAG: hypothetical protein DMF60_04055 [Acidobacteriota bacterium]
MRKVLMIALVAYAAAGLAVGAVVIGSGAPKDKEHGFTLPDFGVRTDIKPGSVNRISFTPDKAGHFAFACDVFCGGGHEDMSGTLIVTE